MHPYLYAFICLIFAGAFTYYEVQERRVMSLVSKTLASLSFVMTGWRCSLFAQDTRTARFLFVGLVLGCVADVLLNLRFLFPKFSDPLFLLGIAVFLSGHVMYLLAILPRTRYFLLCLALTVPITALLLRWHLKFLSASKVFIIFGFFYLGVFVLLLCNILSCVFVSPSTFLLLFTLGAVFFFISDNLLIQNTFRPAPVAGLTISLLAFYYVGQLLIALSIRYL